MPLSCLRYPASLIRLQHSFTQIYAIEKQGDAQIDIAVGDGVARRALTALIYFWAKIISNK